MIYNPDEPGSEAPQQEKKKLDGALGIKNRYCPYDGHYCEQGDCGNCGYNEQEWAVTI